MRAGRVVFGADYLAKSRFEVNVAAELDSSGGVAEQGVSDGFYSVEGRGVGGGFGGEGRFCIYRVELGLNRKQDIIDRVDLQVTIKASMQRQGYKSDTKTGTKG